MTLPNEVLVYYLETKAWAVWTIPHAQFDMFDGRIYSHVEGKFGVYGENPTDNGNAITGKFESGQYNLGDAVVHKLFRRMSVSCSADPSDQVNLYVRATDYHASHSGLPNRSLDGQPVWGVAIWGVDHWGNNSDTTQHVSLPDSL